MSRAIVLLSLVACLAGGALALAGSGSASKAPTPHRITVEVTPNPVAANQPVTVKGRLVGAGAGVRVTLWRQLLSQRHFHVAMRTTTRAKGNYTFTLGGGSETTNRMFFVSGAGLNSRAVHVKVRAAVTLQASDTIPAPGELVTLSGNVSPSYVGHQIQLQAEHR